MIMIKSHIILEGLHQVHIDEKYDYSQDFASEEGAKSFVESNKDISYKEYEFLNNGDVRVHYDLKKRISDREAEQMYQEHIKRESEYKGKNNIVNHKSYTDKQIQAAKISKAWISNPKELQGGHIDWDKFRG